MLAHIKPLKHGRNPVWIIPSQSDTEGLTSMIEDDLERLNTMCATAEHFSHKEVTEAIYWMALGDGSVESPERGNCKIAISHRVDNFDYLVWKASIIQNITGYSLRLMRDKDAHYFAKEQRIYDTKPMVRLRSSTHPQFTKMRNELYEIAGRKCITPHALKLLGPLGLAILYQDDGSYSEFLSKGYPSRTVMIYSLAHSYLEVEALAKRIVDSFGLIFRINQANKGRGFTMRLRNSDIDKFFSIVEPYVAPSMAYKIARGGETQQSFGDVLWTAWKHAETDGNDQSA